MTGISDGAAGRLELRAVEPGRDGSRYFLEGRAVDNGARLELLLDGGIWVPGLFEWSGVDLRWPGLRVALGHLAGQERQRQAFAVLALHPEAVLRWPR